MQERISPHVLSVLEWHMLLDRIASRCKTSGGKDRVSRLSPLAEDAVRNQTRTISALKDLYMRNESPDFSGITDITGQAKRAEKGSTLSLEELFSLRQFTLASGRVRSFLETNKEEFPALEALTLSLCPVDKLAQSLSSSITDECELSAARYPSLRRLRDSLFEARRDAERQVNRMIHSQAMADVLQETVHTTINGRYVLLIKTGMKGRIKGTVHDVSASGATLYYEPDEVRASNDRIIMLEKELIQEIERILQILSGEAGDMAQELLVNTESLAYIDLISAASLFSVHTRGMEPEISDRAEIRLYKARHPLLELLQPGNVVGNDIILDDDSSCVVISGANTGGKTVLLKTIGLVSMMAMCGLHIPAGPGSRIGIFSHIFADIGDDQSLEMSLSTFSGQIMIIRDMLEKADSRSLILIDEIVVGTSPRQGAALARAVLESLVETGARIMVTTHYSELKELASANSRFRNASVSFDMDSLRPTYRLVTGLPGASYALEIARICGLSEGILSRASELVDSTDRSIEALIEETQRFRQELEEDREKIRVLEGELRQERERIADRERKLTEMKQEISLGRGIEFLKELSAYRDEVARHMTSLQGATMRQAQEIQQEIQATENVVRGMLDSRREEKYMAKRRPLDPDDARPGTLVFITSLEKEGIIESVDSDGTVIVRLGAVRSRFKIGELLEADRSGKQAAGSRKKERRIMDEIRSMEGEIPYTMQTAYNTVDLRGKRVEEGLTVLDQELDRMVRSGIDTVVVIHGHGTGAMKEGVRTYLRTSSYCHDFRPGQSEEGGDGVTIVRLRN